MMVSSPSTRILILQLYDCVTLEIFSGGKTSQVVDLVKGCPLGLPQQGDS